MPPKTGLAVTSHIGSSIVSSWSKEFSLSDVVDSETLSSLKSKSELNTKMYNVTPSNPVPVDMDLEELPEGYQNEGSIIEDEESAEEFSEVDMDEVNESEPEAIELMEESDNGSLNSEEGNQPKVPLMKSTKKFKAVSKDAVFTPEERAANPQHNQKAKKDMKKRKKDLKRAMKQIKK
jgi:nuclear GTP-binding protein